MLVLGRKFGEKIVIDLRQFGLELVTVTVMDIDWCKVRIGVEADPRVPVHRLEIWQAGEAAKKAAGG